MPPIVEGGTLTVTDVFNDMSVFNNELDLDSGGDDEDRAIKTVNTAIRFMQTVAASLPHVLQQARLDSPIKTAASAETSPLPFDLLRVDKLWMLDPSTNIPIFPLHRIFETGGHMPNLPWPLNYLSPPTAGMPRGYYPSGDMLFWTPIPDAVYNVRAYGLWAVPPVVDRDSPFPFPVSLCAVVAAFAVKYGNLSVGDATDDAQKVAMEHFTPALRALRRRDRSRPAPRYYEHMHTT